LEAGSKVVDKTFVVVHDLGQIRAADPQIRGVLGQSFLAHFDLFVDYAHKLLCLDETKAMRDGMRGQRVPFVAPKPPEDELPFTERLVISVQLSGTGKHPILLQLDSGSDGPILYPGSEQPDVQALVHAAVPQRGNAQRVFAVVPPQIMQIGNLILSHISFVTPVIDGKNIREHNEDGLLPTVLFQRVFISGRGGDHYVVFDPK
jgi:hypothetical protein